MPDSLTTQERIDLFLFNLENSPPCERCGQRIGVVIWGELVICRECWSELLDANNKRNASGDGQLPA